MLTTPTAARTRRMALALTGTAALALATAAPAGAQSTHVYSKGGTSWVRSCGTLAAGDTMACNALQVTSAAEAATCAVNPDM